MSFSIKEASERLGCPAHTIRYYEKEGLLPFIKRDEHGNRLFEQQDLHWIKLMTCFRATGMPVAALKKIVDLAIAGPQTIPERRLLLENHKQELKRRQQELDDAFEAVDYKLSVYNEIENGKLDAKHGDFKMDDGTQ
ncbi:MerR family transcriptional regulator [Paenibacillus radicis (ex Gao et al. 2016)]|uniref:Transcriptional regulator n=1 Tax=Paenibacillus radicis (ex Gao et al. 2016) TaxID=1737354 RepID=A0A917GYY6_9BACL|nr:MerR family transcriptional regulator [Paenibacillus radicis (ex Gao et al. 2016)]GGG61063.1 transcriptional regulator [Paenibacillus radicis (ex Gao et al. 2016)]